MCAYTSEWLLLLLLLLSVTQKGQLPVQKLFEVPWITSEPEVDLFFFVLLGGISLCFLYLGRRSSDVIFALHMAYAICTSFGWHKNLTSSHKNLFEVWTMLTYILGLKVWIPENIKKNDKRNFPSRHKDRSLGYFLQNHPRQKMALIELQGRPNNLVVFKECWQWIVVTSIYT